MLPAGAVLLCCTPALTAALRCLHRLPAASRLGPAVVAAGGRRRPPDEDEEAGLGDGFGDEEESGEDEDDDDEAGSEQTDEEDGFGGAADAARDHSCCQHYSAECRCLLQSNNSCLTLAAPVSCRRPAVR